MKYHLIYLIYTSDLTRFESEVDTISTILKVTFSNVIVVNNHLAGNGGVNSQRYKLISGDNYCRDFSGYELGLKYLEAHATNFQSKDYLVVLNDTIFKKHFYLIDLYIMRRKLADKVNELCFIGWKDVNRSEICNSLNGPIQWWISTYMFSIPVDFIIEKRLLDSELTPDALFNLNEIRDFFRPHIPAQLREFLKLGIMTPHRGWVGSKVLSQETAVELASKAAAILNEARLTKCAMEHGLVITPVNDSNSIATIGLAILSAIFVTIRKLYDIGLREICMRLYTKYIANLFHVS